MAELVTISPETPRILERAYTEFLLTECRQWFAEVPFSGTGPFASMCTLMAEDLFPFPYAAAVPSYLACGIFLCEKFGASTIDSATSKLNWPVAILLFHCEEHSGATMSEFLNWSNGLARPGTSDPYPLHAVDLSLSVAMLSLMLDDLAQKLKVHESQRGDERAEIWENELRSVIEDRHAKTALIEKFESVVSGSIRADGLSSLGLPIGDGTGGSRSVEESIETLRRWAPYAPLRLPAFSSAEDDLAFWLPKMVTEGCQREVFAGLNQSDDQHARLALRELRRLKAMPRVTFHLTKDHPELEGCVATVACNLEWLKRRLLGN